jgi:hypothetical protein
VADVVATVEPAEAEPELVDDEPEPTEETLDAAIAEAEAAWPDDDEDDGSSYGSLRERGQAALDELASAQQVEEVAEARMAAADVLGEALDGRPDVEPFPESDEAPTPPPYVDNVAIMAELRDLRAKLDEHAEPPVLSTPFEVLTSALRDAGATITAAQFYRAREVLRTYGWTLRMEGLS